MTLSPISLTTQINNNNCLQCLSTIRQCYVFSTGLADPGRTALTQRSRVFHPQLYLSATVKRGLCVPPNSYAEVLTPSTSTTWSYWERGLPWGNRGETSHWSNLLSDRCPYKNGNYGHRHTEEREREDTREQAAKYLEWCVDKSETPRLPADTRRGREWVS